MNGAGLRRRHRRGVSGGCLVRARARKHRRRHRRDYREGDLLKLHASMVGMSAGDGENLITGTSRVARTLSDGIGRPNPNGCELGEGVDCADGSHEVEGEQRGLLTWVEGAQRGLFTSVEGAQRGLFTWGLGSTTRAAYMVLRVKTTRTASWALRYIWQRCANPAWSLSPSSAPAPSRPRLRQRQNSSCPPATRRTGFGATIQGSRSAAHP